MLKWCISCDVEIILGCKLMIYKYLHRLFVFHVFAFEGESARKYSFILRVEQKTQTKKTQLAYNMKECVLISSGQR